MGISRYSGISGSSGTSGTSGVEIELSKVYDATLGDYFIKWRYVGTTPWYSVVGLSEITGDTGTSGTSGTSGSNGASGTNGSSGNSSNAISNFGSRRILSSNGTATSAYAETNLESGAWGAPYDMDLIIVGANNTNLETVIEPQVDSKKDIGSISYKWNFIYSNNLIANSNTSSEIIIMYNNEIKWIVKTDASENLIFVNKLGSTKMTIDQNGGVLFYVD